jgi:hypothetical protein
MEEVKYDHLRISYGFGCIHPNAGWTMVLLLRKARIPSILHLKDPLYDVNALLMLGDHPYTDV